MFRSIHSQDFRYVSAIRVPLCRQHPRSDPQDLGGSLHGRTIQEGMGLAAYFFPSVMMRRRFIFPAPSRTQREHCSKKENQRLHSHMNLTLSYLYHESSHTARTHGDDSWPGKWISRTARLRRQTRCRHQTTACDQHHQLSTGKIAALTCSHQGLRLQVWLHRERVTNGPARMQRQPLSRLRSKISTGCSAGLTGSWKWLRKPRNLSEEHALKLRLYYTNGLGDKQVPRPQSWAGPSRRGSSPFVQSFDQIAIAAFSTRPA
jgi:hypothetical protein